jgi:hypothetical protein
LIFETLEASLDESEFIKPKSGEAGEELRVEPRRSRFRRGVAFLRAVENPWFSALI